MMEWDKSLGEQSAYVKKAVNSLKKHITPEMRDELGGDLNILFGKDVTPAQFLNTWEIIHPESKVGIGEELLNQAGVKGVKYLDNASRGNYQAQTTYKGLPYSDVLNFKTQQQLDDFIKEKKAEGFGIKTFPQTNNYVVFDPSQIKILEENSKPVSRKEIIEKQVKTLKE